MSICNFIQRIENNMRRTPDRVILSDLYGEYLYLFYNCKVTCGI